MIWHCPHSKLPLNKKIDFIIHWFCFLFFSCILLLNYLVDIMAVKTACHNIPLHLPTSRLWWCFNQAKYNCVYISYKGKIYIFVISKFMEIKSIKEEKSIPGMSEFKTSVFMFIRKQKNKTNKDISNANWKSALWHNVSSIS